MEFCHWLQISQYFFPDLYIPELHLNQVIRHWIADGKGRNQFRERKKAAENQLVQRILKYFTSFPFLFPFLEERPEYLAINIGSGSKNTKVFPDCRNRKKIRQPNWMENLFSPWKISAKMKKVFLSNDTVGREFWLFFFFLTKTTKTWKMMDVGFFFLLNIFIMVKYCYKTKIGGPNKPKNIVLASQFSNGKPNPIHESKCFWTDFQFIKIPFSFHKIFHHKILEHAHT